MKEYQSAVQIEIEKCRTKLTELEIRDSLSHTHWLYLVFVFFFGANLKPIDDDLFKRCHRSINGWLKDSCEKCTAADTHSKNIRNVCKTNLIYKEKSETRHSCLTLLFIPCPFFANVFRARTVWGSTRALVCVRAPLRLSTFHPTCVRAQMRGTPELSTPWSLIELARCLFSTKRNLIVWSSLKTNTIFECK